MTAETGCRRLEERLHRIEAGEAPGAGLEAHLRSCSQCRQLWSEWSGWRAIELPPLPLSIEPRRDLWPGIAGQIGRQEGFQRRQPGRLRALLAAALFLLAGATAVWLTSRPSATLDAGGVLADDLLADEPLADQTPLAPSRSRHAADVARFEDGQLAQRKHLMQVVAARSTGLDAELRDSIERDAGLLNEAIGEIRAAMGASAGSGRLDRLLAAQYRQEARLLRTLESLL